MKYLKRFETYNTFEIGDFVKTYRDLVFEVIRRERDRYMLMNINDPQHTYWEIPEEMILATPEDIEKYKMKKDIQKYNL